MANKKWCSFCSYPNLYEVTPPKYCGKCSKDMSTAFASIPVVQPKPTVSTAVAREEYVPPVTPLRRPKPLYGTYEDSEPKDRSGHEDDVDEHYSRSEMKARAGQFAQAFAGAFNFSVDPGVTIKAGSILAPIQGQAEKGTSTPKKRAKRVK